MPKDTKQEEIQKEVASEEVIEALTEEVVSPESLEVAEVTVSELPIVAPEATNFRRGGKGGMREGDRRPPRRTRRDERPRSEFDQKILSIRRVARVVAGGRRFSFSVALVAGNRKGLVGIGMGKAGDTALAIEKAFRDAKKNMVSLSLTKSKSIPHDVKVKYSSATLTLQPSKGRGLVAGGAVRSVLELGGVNDVSGKILSRSKNKINIAKAAIKALSTLRTNRIRRSK